jgi:hypothetical protein
MNLDLITVAAVLHTFGAALGTALVTFAEVFYIEAAIDGKIDHHERKYLRHLFRSMKFGITLVAATGIALIVLEYLVPDAPRQVYAASFWATQIFTIFIILLAALLAKRLVSWRFGSAGILAGWWMLLVTDLGYFINSSFSVIISSYLVLSLVLAAALYYLHKLVKAQYRKSMS